MSTPAKTHRPTPGQTVGPFFAYGLEFPKQHEVAFPHSPGAIVLGGTVYDGAGAPIPDALVEIFGADADGAVPRLQLGVELRRHPREPGGIGGSAAFFAAIVFARGLPNKLHTRIYVPGDDAALAADPLLSSLDAEERASLVATRTPDGHLHHDIRLQGEKETVFLAF